VDEGRQSRWDKLWDVDRAMPPELDALLQAFAASERDARALIDGLSEADGTWQPAPGGWSVAQCLDHLAVGHRVYLTALEPAAAQAEREGRTRRRPALPGFLGAMFVKSLDAPPSRKMRAPEKIVPRPSPPLADASAAFFAAHARLEDFVRRHAGLDLASIRFVNPFIRGLRFSLATGVHALAAHERRHLRQAWNVRRSRR
jgi:hypothetical protein